MRSLASGIWGLVEWIERVGVGRKECIVCIERGCIERGWVERGWVDEECE